MVTRDQDYLAYLYRLQDPNRQTEIIPLSTFTLTEEEFKKGTYYIEKDGRFSIATKYEENELYYNEPIYHINLNTRTIEAPKFLSVEFDHNAETVYFCVDRYFDNVDLSMMFAVVQFENANPVAAQRGWIYSVPFFDTTGPMVPEGKMLFPWVIQGPATAFAGKVTFSIKFYRIKEIVIDNINGTQRMEKEYEYVLNTQPAASQILHGLEVYTENENYTFQEAIIEDIYQRIIDIERYEGLYWTVLTAPISTDHINPVVEGITDKSNDIYNNIE